MLALRLSGARSIRAQPNGQSCCAHITRAGVNGRSRPPTSATIGQKRNYAKNDSKNDAAAPSNNDGPNANSKGAKAQSSRPPPAFNTMDLIRNSMDLLRRFKEDPRHYAAEEGKAGKGQEDNKESKQKYDIRQNMIFTQTLEVLKDALQIHAAATLQNGKGAQDSNAAGTIKAAYDVVKSLDPKADNELPKASKKSTKSVGADSKADKFQAQSPDMPENKAANVKQKFVSITKQPAKQTRDKKPPTLTHRAEAKAKAAKEAELDKTKSKTTEAQPDAKKSQPERTLEKQEKEIPVQEDSNEEAKKASDPVAAAVTASLASVVNIARAKSAPSPPKVKPKHEVKPKHAARHAAQRAATQDGPSSADSIKDEEQYTIEPEERRVQKHPNNEKEPKKDKEVKKSRSSKKAKKHNLDVETFRADPASALVPVAETTSVPLIQYGLDRVLFKEGVYPLQDPRTRVWNFDPYLASIMPVSEFDFDALTQYITSSKDQKLIGMAKDRKKKYTGSTSSMTSTLAHFHFLLSQWRPINPARLTQAFDFENDSFSGITKAPAAVFLNYKDGVYAIDADKEWDDETILSMLGKSMEKLMTVPKDDFEKYHRDRSHQLTDDEKGQEESYHYTTYGDFMMRSQLDAYDPRLPGTGVYDLKTRAVVSIRTDATNPEQGVGYEIRQRDGNWESFEREYADLIRAAFLKYSLQVRMGRMDGIFVAYHNTERIFGFQYIPLEEMDLSMHGTMDKTLGDMEFTASLKMLNDLINRATAKFPKQSLRIFVECRQSDAEKPVHFLYFFAEPVTDKEIKDVQETKEGAIDSFKRRFGILRDGEEDAKVDPAIDEAAPVEEASAAEEPEIPASVEVEVKEDDSADIWEDMMEVVEDTMNKDAEGITAIRDAIKEALEQSGLLKAKSSEEAERYVEALLKSMVDTGSEPVKAEEVPGAEASEDTTTGEPEATESSAPESSASKKSGLGSLFSWFSAKPDVPESPAKEPPQESQERIEEETAPALDSDTKHTTSVTSKGDTDNRQSPELVELLLKLTSHVELTTSNGKQSTSKVQQQEQSDDQASIQSFQRILSELIPEAVESTKSDAKAGEKDAPGTSSGSAATEAAERKEPKDVFGLVVSVRNKVNSQPVERPNNLKRGDKWEIDYAVEELESEKIEKLYSACKARRKMTLSKSHKKTWKQDPLRKAVVERTLAGRAFRQRENALTQGKPVWIVGQHKPLPAEEVWTGSGVKLDVVLPSLDVPRPTAGEFPTEIAYNAPLHQYSAYETKKHDFKKDSPQKDDSTHLNKTLPSFPTLKGPKDRLTKLAGPFGKPSIDDGTGRTVATPFGKQPLDSANTTSFGNPPLDSTGANPIGIPRLDSPWPGQVPVEAVEKSSKGSDVSAEEASSLNSWLQLATGDAAPDASEEVGEKEAGKEEAIAQSVAELRKSEETKASSFKEWREKSKQKE